MKTFLNITLEKRFHLTVVVVTQQQEWSSESMTVEVKLWKKRESSFQLRLAQASKHGSDRHHTRQQCHRML